MKPYTITYEPGAFSGELGYWYRIRSGPREIGSGWSRGSKAEAERTAKHELRRLERGRAA